MSGEVKEMVATRSGVSPATTKRAAKAMHERGELIIQTHGFPRSTRWALSVGSQLEPTASSISATPFGGRVEPQATDLTPEPPSGERLSNEVIARLRAGVAAANELARYDPTAASLAWRDLATEHGMTPAAIMAVVLDPSCRAPSASDPKRRAVRVALVAECGRGKTATEHRAKGD